MLFSLDESWTDLPAGFPAGRRIPSYSPSPVCPALPSGDEWRGEPSEALAKEGYGEFRILLRCPARERGELHLRWLPAPMNNSMGIDNMKLTREARSAVRPHWAISAGAGVPWAAAVTAAIILLWFGQIIAWTLAIMMIPNNRRFPTRSRRFHLFDTCRGTTQSPQAP